MTDFFGLFSFFRRFELVIVFIASFVLLVLETISITLLVGLVLGNLGFAALGESYVQRFSGDMEFWFAILVICIRGCSTLGLIWLTNALSLKAGLRWSSSLLRQMRAAKEIGLPVESELPKFLLTFSSRLTNGVFIPCMKLLSESLIVFSLIVLSIVYYRPSFSEVILVAAFSSCCLIGFFGVLIWNKILVAKRATAESKVYRSISDFQDNWFMFEIFGQAGQFVKRLAGFLEVNNKIAAKIACVLATPKIFLETMVAGLALGILFFGPTLNIEVASADRLGLSLVYFARAGAGIYKISGLITIIYNSLPDVLNTNNALNGYTDESTRLLDHFGTYKIQFSNLAGVTVDLPTLLLKRGHWSVIQGPNGIGKSTFFKLLIGALTRPNVVSSLAGGNEVIKTISYIPQETYLLDESLVANVIVFRDYDAHRLSKCLLTACIDPESDQLQKFWENSAIGRSGGILSGGFRQRIGIARALFMEPDLLLIDEGFSAISLNVADNIRRNIKDNYPETAVLEISHSPVGISDSVCYVGS